MLCPAAVGRGRTLSDSGVMPSRPVPAGHQRGLVLDQEGAWSGAAAAGLSSSQSCHCASWFPVHLESFIVCAAWVDVLS